MIRWAKDSYWQDDQMVAEVDERGRERHRDREGWRGGGGGWDEMKWDHKFELTAAD